MTFSLRFLWLALASLVLAACATSPRGEIAYAPENFQEPKTASVEDYLSGAYRVLPQDEVKITVFRVPDLSGSYRVGNGGTLDLPLVGQVNAAGLTETELARALERRYGMRYLQDPSIQVQVTSVRTANVVLEGAVRDPGRYDLKGRTSLLEAIALANGLDNATANPKRIVIIREMEGETYRAAYDLRQVREGLMPNPQIYGGDIVVVDGSNLRQTLSDVIQSVPVIALFVRAL